MRTQGACVAPATSPFLPLDHSFPTADSQTVTYENVVSAWFAAASQIRTVTCPNGVDQCLIVPVLSNSSTCSVDYGRCGATAGSPTERCVASDDSSQFGIALAMARGDTYAARFREWYNTLAATRALGKYGLPPWVVRVVWTASPTTIAPKGTDDPNLNDAIDGSARMALALYIAANNPTFPDEDRVLYARVANEMSYAMLAHDFVHRSLTVRGRIVSQWLTAGWKVAETNGNVYCGEPPERKQNCGTIGFAGYYGDVMIALLAAYANSGDVAFRNATGDTLQNYLYAAKFDGAHFRVPSTEFSWWDTPPAGGEFEALCKNTCDPSPCSSTGEGQWESYDAPRAVSLCKSAYFWSRLGTVDDDLRVYCEGWMNTPNAIGPSSYRKIYSWDGNACVSGDQGFYNNGLAAYLNFFCDSASLESRLASIFATYRAGDQRFDETSCMGIYLQTFPVISFGSATGRDLDALTVRPAALVATGGSSQVQLSWAGVSGTDQYEVWRKSSAAGWQVIASSVPAASYTDTGTVGGTAYLYKVRAIPSGGPASPFSNIDLATVFGFEDDPIVAATTRIRSTHIDNLRSAIDSVRALAGLPAATYTRPVLVPGVSIITTVDILEMRTQLAAALTALGFETPAYTQQLAAGSTSIRAADVSELRSATR